MVVTKKDGSQIFMTLNKDNCLVKYKDDFVEEIGDILIIVSDNKEIILKRLYG